MPKRNLEIPALGTRSFFQDVDALTEETRMRARKAFVRWRLGIRSKGLNCEKLHNRAGAEYRSIRGSRTIRLLYVERDGGALFFAANLHDYEAAEEIDLASLVPEESLSSWDPDPAREEEIRTEAEAEDNAPDADPDLLPEDNPFSRLDLVSDKQMLDLGVLWEDVGAVRNLESADELLDLLERRGDALPGNELMALFDSPRRDTLERLLRDRRRLRLPGPEFPGLPFL